MPKTSDEQKPHYQAKQSKRLSICLQGDVKTGLSLESAGFSHSGLLNVTFTAPCERE